VASNTREQSYALWDIATGTRRELLPAIELGYTKASVSPDGRMLATLTGVNTSAGNAQIRLWSAASGAEVNRPEKNRDHFSVAWSPDGSTLAGGGSGFIVLWNAANGKLNRVLTGHEGRVLGVAFRPDGERLASVGDDRTVRIWNTESGALLRVIRGHTNIVTCLAYGPSGDRLVTGSQDGTARVWDLTKDEETGCVDDRDRVYQRQPVEAIASARRGREALLFHRDGLILRLQAGSLDQLEEIVAGSEMPWMTPAEPVAFDAQGHRLIAIDPRVRREAICLELDGQEQKTTLRGHEFSIRFVTLSADGSRAATAGSSDAQAPIRACEVLVWDAASGTLVQRRQRINEVVTRIALDPTGKRLAIAGVDLAGSGDNRGKGAAPFVAVIDVESEQEVLRNTVVDDQLWAVRFSANGRRLAAAGLERTLLVWDIDTRRILAQTRQGPEGAMDLDFSTDGRRLAVASRHQVTLADAESAEAVLILRGKPQLTPNSHGFNPRVRFSLDGRSLLAICDDHHDSFAEWSLTGDSRDDREARLQSVRRRAANQHLGRSLWLTWTHPGAPVDYDLDQAEQYGLETATQYLRSAEVRAAVGRWSRVEDDLNSAVSKARYDETVVAKAALVYADAGRFSSAGTWFARLSRVPASLSCIEWWRHGPNLVLARDHAHYRLFAEALWQRFHGALDAATRCDLAYACALTPVTSPHTEELLHIARQGCAQTLAAKATENHGFALIVLGAVQVRAAEYECAEATLLAALDRAHDDFGRALARAWLTIALALEGRRDEAKACFDQADRFVRSQVTDGRPEREQPAPLTLAPHSWWRLLLAWREAHGLILDGPFPANPFAR
jgi:WD40 repeat protein